MTPHRGCYLAVLAVFAVCFTGYGEYRPILNWDVCSSRRIVVTLSGAADGGIIYIKGYGSACKQGTTSNVTVHDFDFDACGIVEAETYFTIIVQRNPLYQKGGDLQESLLCIYDLRDISVGNGVNIGEKDDDSGVNKTVKPTAHMYLYKDGSDVAGSSVKLTDMVTMTIQLDEEYLDDFDIKARSCRANIIDITLDYCASDVDLFPNFVRVNQGVLTAMFPAFRSTELSGGLVEMIFTCTLQVCLGSCAPSSCNDGRVIDEGYGRKKRDFRRSTSFEEVAYDEVNVGATLSIGTDIDIKPNKPKEGESICIHNATFIAGLLAMFGVLVTSVSLTTCAIGKMLKQSEHIRKLTSDNEALQKTPSDSKVSVLNKPLTQIKNKRMS